jgi:hypothetical protein
MIAIGTKTQSIFNQSTIINNQSEGRKEVMKQNELLIYE